MGRTKTVTRSSLWAIITALTLVVIAAGGYAGRLRWQNALLRADLAYAQAKLAAARTSRPVAAAPASGPVVTADRTLTADQRSAMLERLAEETGTQKDVWFTWAAGNAEAAAFQRAIQGVFEEAGWTVRRSAVANFSLRPGLFFLMADASPPPYVSAALGAIRIADDAVSSGRDYRAFNERKKLEDPSWRGFEMDADQSYIVAVGRRPNE